jgi:hypothetical protein
MRLQLSQVAAVALTTALLGCAKQQQSGFDVSSRNFDVSPLVGEWAGEFSSAETGRHGTITFTVQPRESTGSGEVTLLPDRIAGDAPSAAQQPAAGNAVAAGGLVFKISLMRIDGDTVVGRIEPYLDPLCNCQIASTFKGLLQGRTIAGRYSSVGVEDGLERFHGSWTVTRLRRL